MVRGRAVHDRRHQVQQTELILVAVLFPLLLVQDVSRPLEVVSAADARFTSRVELSVRFGKTLLVLECDGVEPMLYPLARQDLVHQGPRYVVQVGDKVRKPATSDGMGG